MSSSRGPFIDNVRKHMEIWSMGERASKVGLGSCNFLAEGTIFGTYVIIEENHTRGHTRMRQA